MFDPSMFSFLGGAEGISSMLGAGAAPELAAASAGGGGFGDVMSKLFGNKLFLQYLSAAGQDVVSGNPIGTNVNAVTQQNISAQNYSKLLNRMLGGYIPEGGKIVSDSKGMKLDIPKSALETSGGQGTGSLMSAQTTTVPKFDSQFLNPFDSSQSEIPAADLAGLTPNDISTALNARFTRDQIERKSVNDLMDHMIKAKELSLKIEESDRTPATKSYEYATRQGYKGTFEDWEKKAITGHMNDYEAAVKSGYKEPFWKWMLDMAKAGAINLGEKVTEKKAMSELGGLLYFDNPKWIDDVTKHLSDKSVRSKIATSDNVNKTRELEIIDFVESKITGTGGSVIKVGFAPDNRTMIWKVKWPSGDVREVKYAIR